jgi:hypothetical protein
VAVGLEPPSWISESDAVLFGRQCQDPRPSAQLCENVSALIFLAKIPVERIPQGIGYNPVSHLPVRNVGTLARAVRKLVHRDGPARNSVLT